MSTLDVMASLPVELWRCVVACVCWFVAGLVARAPKEHTL
jgi:hypothetical protein